MRSVSARAKLSTFTVAAFMTWTLFRLLVDQHHPPWVNLTRHAHERAWVSPSTCVACPVPGRGQQGAGRLRESHVGPVGTTLTGQYPWGGDVRHMPLSARSYIIRGAGGSYIRAPIHQGATGPGPWAPVCCFDSSTRAR